MFCQKCGNKLEEKAIFCSKCGTRLSVAAAGQSADNQIVSNRQKAEDTAQPAVDYPCIQTHAKASEMLRENAALCPEVKKVLTDESRSAAVAEGRFNRYTVKVLNGQIGLNSFPVFPFVIPMALCILSVVFLITAMYMSVYSGDFTFLGLYGEELMLPIEIFMLLSGLSGIGVSVFANKEKRLS